MPAGTPVAGPTLGQRWSTLPRGTQFGAVFGVLALLAILVAMTFTAKTGDYRVLFPQLSDKDGGAVIDRLAQMNVPYRIADGGSSIMVPGSRVHELRMKLAQAGLPSSGPSAAAGSGGYELLDKNSFGQTQVQERMKIQRAIEGELTTTIQSLDSVKSARVHLALPAQNGFFREQQKPSASVVLNLHPGRTLDRAQVAGIVKLVSGSVPELSPKAVSVVDSTGALLSAAGDDETQLGLDSQQLQYRRELEATHHKRILALLEPVVGGDNVRATVTADVDFSQVMQTAEAYAPNQGADAKAAVREQRSEESNQPQAAAGGVPGAVANQPPVPAQAPINGAAQPLGAQQAGGAGAATRREAATRFEVDKTTTVTRQAVGQVRRLNAAVVVNHRSTTDARGKTSTQPLSDKELEELTALVQQGIGFNADRGDVVKVVNVPFRVEPVTPPEATPLWQQPWLLDLLRSAAAPFALALVALVVVFKLIKPAMTQMLAPPPPPPAPPPGSQLDEVVGAEPLPLLAPEPQYNRKIESARAMARQNPAAVASIVRGWVNGEKA
ncbi:MAG: flagellar M-ring protein FliF [Rubrivivax sp.]|nr:flagellar M-ring protein FliF [Rubrivivax sp.]